MKKFFKYLGITFFAILVALYLEFLFFIPNLVELDAFKCELQKIVKEQTRLDVDFENTKIITTPLLGVGFKTENVRVNLPDGSSLFSADLIKGKLSVPSLLLLTVKVYGVEVVSPSINLDIADSKAFKVVEIFDGMLTEQEDNIKVESAPTQSWFNPEWIRIKLTPTKISNYSLSMNDLKSGHKLALTGDNLALSYNVNKARLVTNAKVLSNDNENIIANIDIDTFIPKAAKLDEEDDPAQRVELPFINPVLMYESYDFKANIDTKLKIRDSRNGLKVKGIANLDGATLKLADLRLPESSVYAKFGGQSVETNMDFFITPQENIKLSGLINYSSKPFMDIELITDKIFFNDVIILTKSLMDSLHLKHNLNTIKASGYILADTKIKSDFKKLESSGSIVIREGSVIGKTTGAAINDMNANIVLEDNMLNIVDSYVNINNTLLKFEGKIDDKSIADISIYTKNLPLSGLYRTFAPNELKNAYDLSSANLSLDIKVLGEMKKAAADIDVALNNLKLTDRISRIQLTNESAEAVLKSDFKSVSGKFENKNFRLSIPATGSTVHNPEINIDIDNNNIVINKNQTNINSASIINFAGMIENYMKKPRIAIEIDGKANARDLVKLAGRDAAPFLKANGTIPIDIKIKGDAKRQELIAQILADSENYFTPVDIDSLVGKQTLLQAKVNFKGDRLHIKDTGIYTRRQIENPDPKSEEILYDLTEIVGVKSTIANINIGRPFINLLRISIPNDLHGSIVAFKNSSFTLSGNLFAFGDALSPRSRGRLKISDLNIPDLKTTMKDLNLGFKGKFLEINTTGLVVNDSDMQISATVDLNPSSVIIIPNLKFTSNNLDVDKLMTVSEKAMSFMAPPLPNAQPADIPIRIRNGSIDIKRLSAKPIVLSNTTGRIALRNNVFTLTNLNTNTFDGVITGRVFANLKTMLIGARVQGKNLNCEKALLTLAEMKDSISGDVSFKTDITLKGATYEEQMKSLKGTVDFEITDGQLGPFGKLENLILAENIRESQFFQTALGGVINSITTVNTSRFNVLGGHLSFEDGIATISPITSRGDVLCLHIGGTMDLLKNTIDMKLRGRLGSQMSDMLGPLAAINPVNLVKVTPGLNFMAAKAFMLFCEQVTQEELDALPDFEEEFNVMSTTKFQVVLRGDVAKPLTLVKSFKWLALASEIEQAEGFVSTLPSDEEIEKIEEQEMVSEMTKKERFRYFFKKRFEHKKKAN